MSIDIITLFPEMFNGPFDASIVKRAQDRSFVTINLHNLRKWAIDQRGTVDDKPYGGGTGMLLRPEPIFKAVEDIKSAKKKTVKPYNQKIILLDAGGASYTQKKAQEYSKLDQIIIICGHYEGVDYRVHEHLADEVITIGDYVLTGGEIPAMVVVDSLVRLICGVLEKKEATAIESFNQISEVEFPQYTRPEECCGYKVPDVLLSGNHAEIEKWRANQAKMRTDKNRPDLTGRGK